MATASILSRVTAPAAKPDITDASRDDLTLNDVVDLESVNAGTAYQWSIAFKPEGSAAVFSSTGTEQAVVQNPGTFTVDVEGPYLIRLVLTDGTGTTEQFVRLRALTAFGSLKLVAAGERYDTIRVPVDTSASGWADEQNHNLNALLGMLESSSASRVVYVDPESGDHQTIQAAIDYAVTQVPQASSQWAVLVRPGTYTEDLTFAPWVHVLGWPGGEGSALVEITNASVASHVMALPGATETVVLSNLRFAQSLVTPNPVISQTVGGGRARLVRCDLVTVGTGEAYLTLGTTEFEDCTFVGGSGVSDRAVRADAARIAFSRCTLRGGSGLSLGNLTEAHLRDCTVVAAGSYAIDTSAELVRVEYSHIEGQITANASGAGAPGNLTVDVRWSTAQGIDIDGTLVVGTAQLLISASQHGAITATNGAAVAATNPADTVFYDNTVSGLAAEDVQAALDEVYAYAALVRTLDDAYDGGGGAGSGRTIIADQGAVQIVDANPPTAPVPGKTDGSLEVVGTVSLGAIGAPEIRMDPNPYGSGPGFVMGETIWPNDAPYGGTAFISGNASGNPSYHNYNLHLGTLSADGGNKVGDVMLYGGNALASINAGSVYVQGGSALDAGGDGGSVFLVPGTSVGGTQGATVLVGSGGTPSSLTAAGAFSGSAVAGTVYIGTEQGQVAVTFAGGENLAAVHALFNATGVVTAAGDPIVLTTTATGVTAQVYFLREDPVGVDAALGTFSGQVMVPGAWPHTVSLGATGPSEITFGVGDPNPMVYDSTTGKLTVPGLIDPTGMIFDEAAQPATGAGKGALFVSDGSGGLVLNRLYYVNASGTATDLTTGGGGGGTLQDAYNGGNTIGTALGNDIEFTLSSGDFVVEGPGAVSFGASSEVSSLSGYSAGGMALQSRDTTLIQMQASDAATKTLTVEASNALGSGDLVFRAGNEIQLVPGTAASAGTPTKATLPDNAFLSFGVSEYGISYVPAFSTLVFGFTPDSLTTGGKISVPSGTSPDNMLFSPPEVETNSAGVGSNSGSVTLQSGNTSSSTANAGDSGSVSVRTGNAEGTTGGGFSGNITVRTGQSKYSSSGEVAIESGQVDATSTGGSGLVAIGTGNANGTGQSGEIRIQTGSATNNDSGSILLSTGAAPLPNTRGFIRLDADYVDLRNGSDAVGMYVGSGDPNSVVIANAGSVYHDASGGGLWLSAGASSWSELAVVTPPPPPTTLKTPFNGSSVSPIVSSPVTAGDVVLECYIRVITPFGPTATVQVGTPATPDLFMAAGDSNLNAAGVYKVAPVEEITGGGTDLQLTLSGFSGPGQALFMAILYRA